MTVPVCGAFGAITIGFMAADIAAEDLLRCDTRCSPCTAGRESAGHCLLTVAAAAARAMCSMHTGSRCRRAMAMHTAQGSVTFLMHVTQPINETMTLALGSFFSWSSTGLHLPGPYHLPQMHA